MKKFFLMSVLCGAAFFASANEGMNCCVRHQEQGFAQKKNVKTRSRNELRLHGKSQPLFPRNNATGEE